MNSVSFTVPLVPPSVNMYVRHTRSGRHYVSKDALAFKQAVATFARGRGVSGREYAAYIAVYLGSGDRRDLDNCAKCILDGMVEARVIHSDAAVTELLLRKFRDPKNPRTEITVRVL